MNKFPKLLDLSLIIAKISWQGPSAIREFLMERGFSSRIEEGDYIVPDDWDGRPSVASKVIEVDSATNLLRHSRSERLWFHNKEYLKVPGEYLVWSDGKDNKTVPLNCESLFIEGLKDPMLEREGLCQETPLPLAEDVEYVTCTNNTDVGGYLTIGKEYKVVNRYVRHTGSEFITVIDDDGRENRCYASRFVAKEDKGKDRFNFNIKGATAETFKAAALRIREKLEKGDIKFDIDDRGEGTPTKAYSALQTPPASNTTYVVCPTTGRKLDPNTLIPLDEVVTFTDKPII